MLWNPLPSFHAQSIFHDEWAHMLTQGPCSDKFALRSPAGWCTKRLLWKERTLLSLLRTRVLIILQLVLFFIFPFWVSYQATAAIVPKEGSWITAGIYSLAQLDVSANGAVYERGSCTLQMTYICLDLANIFPVKITSIVTWEPDFVPPTSVIHQVWDLGHARALLIWAL